VRRPLAGGQHCRRGRRRTSRRAGGAPKAIFIALLALIACGRPHADDATLLRAQLASMRHAIATYRAQRGHPPKTLDDLVAAHLINAVPVDPITNSATTWKTDVEESVAVNDDFRATTTTAATPSGIIDVHSGAPGRDASGKPWAEY
jgi:general secretion pathway protein G